MSEHDSARDLTDEQITALYEAHGRVLVGTARDLARLVPALLARAQQAEAERNRLAARLPKCPHGDPYCPCQDGDPCHYEPSEDTPAMHCADWYHAERAEAQLAAIRDVIRHAQAASPSPSMHVYDAPRPHKLGGGDA